MRSDRAIPPLGRQQATRAFTSRCQTTPCGHNRWKIRLDSSLSPDISVAARLDPSNQAQLDYYLLPRIDFGPSRISLAEQNPVEFESYHFESLDYLYGMAARARLRVAA